ncbi:hypothetical protein MFLAVUS_004367 [Mucor flavus]|uniref:Uncharacterized protein n=1 Tax=Mucor flavus TaxID=439312 RepID=A0ABP9YVP3_9FUNG
MVTHTSQKRDIHMLNNFLKSTALLFSLLSENGLVKEILSLDYFEPDISFGSLGSFFSFSELSTLNCFTNDPNFFSVDKNNVFDKGTVAVIEDLLNLESSNKDLLVSTQQQIDIKAFVSTYWIYINNIVSRKLPAIPGRDDDTKAGYCIFIESVLLKRLFGTEDDLRDIIYASNLVHKDDSSKKLRIATQGERLFSVIPQSSKPQFSLKSFFLVAQLYEDYIHLTLNQVVTESSSDEEDQEAIALYDELICMTRCAPTCEKCYRGYRSNSIMRQP